MSINVKSVSKIYKTQKALNNVSFAAEKGQIVGFLGPNGAGKSTIMKILTGFIKPTDGEVFVNEIDVKQFPLEVQKIIGLFTRTQSFIYRYVCKRISAVSSISS